MSTFEGQLIKWAAKKWKIGAHLIREVTLSGPYYNDIECPTCGTGEVAYEFTLHLKDGAKRFITVTDTNEESTIEKYDMQFNYGYDAFKKLLKEMIEA